MKKKNKKINKDELSHRAKLNGTVAWFVATNLIFKYINSRFGHKRMIKSAKKGQNNI